MSNKILVVDDETEIADLIEVYLKNENYTVFKFYTAQEALNCIETTPIDLAILDIMLPDIDGFTLCKKIREHHTYPIIMLTAKDAETDKITGLTLGADDYITKPFRLKELLVRIKSVFRRYNNDSTDGKIKVKDLVVNTNEAKVYKNGNEIVLTAMEYRLLLILLNNRGCVLSRTQLLENIWDVAGDFVEDNTLTVYIKRLRDKIEENPTEPEYIKTIRGLGYIIENE